MTTAFVLSGGGSVGAVQVGMLQALTARGVEPARLGAATLGWAPSLCHNGPIGGLVREHLAFDRLEDAPVPLHVVATDVGSGQDVLLSDGDAVDAVLDRNPRTNASGELP
jgi:NTE family protein